jgi:hypothetical protein
MNNYPKSFRPKWSFVKSVPGEAASADVAIVMLQTLDSKAGNLNSG